jgi:hypothetical protein
MFFVVGDAGMLRNLPYRPIFDPALGALFVVGVGMWLYQLIAPKSNILERWRAVFFLVWLGLALSLSLISDDAPNNGRVLIGLPVVMILPAWGAVEIWHRWRAPARRYATIGALALIVVFSATRVYLDYFETFGNDPATYYAFNADKVEIARWLNRNASTHQIFLAPLLQQNATISLLARNTPLKSFESKDTIVLSSRLSGKDALYVFPIEQAKKFQMFAERLGTLGAREELTGSNGGKLAFVYRVPAQNLPDAQNVLSTFMRGGEFIQPQTEMRAVWNNAFELLGYSIDATDAAKRNLEVTLFFHVLQPMSEDYTFSVKVRDAQDRVWGQEDKWLGDNSYATTQWLPGDVIIEKFYPGLNACAPAGEYRLTVEAYNPKTMQVFGDVVALGMTRAQASPSNRIEDLDIVAPFNIEVAPQMRLLGYTLTPDNGDIRESFSLSLFWRGVGNGLPSRISIKLRDATNREFVLHEQTILLPTAGRGLCTFFDLTVPPEVSVGTGIMLLNDANFIPLEITR